MSEQMRPTINQVLFVSEGDLEEMRIWPVELRALFDPRVDRMLAKQVRSELKSREEALRDEVEVPFLGGERE